MEPTLRIAPLPSFQPSFLPGVGFGVARAPEPEPEPEPEPPPPAVDLDAVRAEAAAKARAEVLAEVLPRIRELQERLADAQAVVDELPRLRREALDQAAGDVAALVTTLAERVLNQSLALHPDALPTLVRRAIERLPEEEDVWIRVPPAAADRVREALPERHRARVSADPSLVGGCVVGTRYAAIDTSLETAVRGVEEAVSTWLAGRT